MEKQAILFGAFLVFSSVCFAAAPVLEVSPENLEFVGRLGDPNPAVQIISVWRDGGSGPLNWEVAEDCNWLAVEPNSGTSLGEVDDVNVMVDISELSEGLYNCELTVWADNAVNSPQIIDVELLVTIEGDIDLDGDVDLYDYSALASAWMSEFGSPHWDPACDITGDFVVDVFDLVVMVDNWLESVSDGEVLMAGDAGIDTDGSVYITLTDDGDGWIAVSYDASAEPNFVRAFALDIVAYGANIVEIDSLNPDYWVYPGSIYIDANGEVNDFGTPVADPCVYPGTLGGLDTNGITIEMCALFDPLTESPPPAAGTLLRVRVDGFAVVCAVVNTVRGGVVMSDGSGADPGIVCYDMCGPPLCPGDLDSDNDIDLTDYYTMQGTLNYACYLNPDWCWDGIPCDDPNTTGGLYNLLMDMDRDCDVDRTDYFTLQGRLNHAYYLTGAYLIIKEDPATGFLYKCYTCTE